MDPLKAAAAAAFCLVLFWLAYRLTRRLVDLAIAQGHAQERRLAEEAGTELSKTVQRPGSAYGVPLSSQSDGRPKP